MKKWLFIFIPAATLVTGCYFDKEESLYSSNCVITADVHYTNTVKPIVDANCNVSGCHTAATNAGGYNLSDYTGLKAIAASGQLMGSITHATGYSQMPQGREKLSDCQISQIQTWVTNGALND